MSDDIKKNATAVSCQHDLPGFGVSVEFGLRGETGVPKNFSQINRPLYRGETMIGNDKDICRFTRFSLI